MNWRKSSAVKFTHCRFGILALALVASLFFISTSGLSLAQSSLDGNRALTTTGKRRLRRTHVHLDASRPR